MRKWITCYLVLAMVVIGVVPPVEASFLSSETMKMTVNDRALDLQFSPGNARDETCESATCRSRVYG